MLDRPSAIGAASYLSSLTQLSNNLQPLMLGALAIGYGMNDRTLGQIGAALVGSVSLMNLTAPFWIRRVNWRTFSLISTCLCAATFFLGSMASTAGQFMAVFLLMGLIQSCVGAPSFATLGDSSNPERSYAVFMVVQSIITAAVAPPLSSYIIPNFGAHGLFIFLAILIATGAISCYWLPPAGREQVHTKPDGKAHAKITMRDAAAPLLALLSLFVFTFGVYGYWFFDERIGAARGHSATDIGIILSAGALASILSAAAAAWMGGRVRNRVPVIIGSVGLILSFMLLHIQGEAAYAVSNILFAMSYGLAQPPYWAMLRKVDATNRLFVLTVAAQGSSGVAVGLVAGPIIESGGYNALLAISAAAVAAAMVVLAISAGIAGRQQGVRHIL